MKKRIFNILLVILLCISTAIPVSASLGDTTYVIDESGNISDSELALVNEYAKSLSDAFGVDLLYIYTKAESLSEYIDAADFSNAPNYILMIENDSTWKISIGGTGASYIQTEDEVQLMRKAYDDAEYYYTGVQAYMDAAVGIIVPKMGAAAGNDAIADNVTEDTATEEQAEIVMDVSGTDVLAVQKGLRLNDMADLLSDKEEANVLAKLDEVSENQSVDVAIVTAASLDGKSAMDYAEAYYEENNFGFGAEKDGVIFLVSMEDRDWWIATRGYAITAITDAGREYIAELFLPDLSDGNYEDAFMTYANSCDQFITQAKTGEPYDGDHMPKEPFNLGFSFVISLAIGFVIAFIVTSVMKSKLKTVKHQAAATEYVLKDSLNIVYANEIFLHRNVDQRERVREERSSSGGSSTHTSDSGATYGGGGGKF